MTKENWKDVKGFEGMYLVSSLGKVKSIERKVKLRGKFSRIHNERILIPVIYNKKRFKVGLSKGGKCRMFYVHRVVAEAFIPKREGKDFINHKDCNPKNNNVLNLEWCTYRENMDHGVKNNRFGRKVR